MFKTFKPALVVGMIASSAMITAPASAQDAGSLFAQLKQSGAATSYVWGRGFGHRGFHGGRGFGHRGFAGRGFHGRPAYGYGYGRRRGVGAGAVLGGLAAGALIGGAIAAQATPGPVYAPPGGDAVAYCQQKFKSYDPASGTYLGYDGARHACP